MMDIRKQNCQMIKLSEVFHVKQKEKSLRTFWGSQAFYFVGWILKIRMRYIRSGRNKEDHFLFFDRSRC